MNRTAIKLTDNRWKSLATKSFSKIFINHSQSSGNLSIHIAGLPKSAEGTTTSLLNLEPTDGIAILSRVLIPPNTTLCLEDISVSNISSTIGNVNTDDFELMIRTSTTTPDVSILLES